jgi:hypothetical protein
VRGPARSTVPVDSVTSSTVTSSMMMNLSNVAKRPLANHRVAGREDAFLARKRFDLREDMPLRIQQQPDGSLPGLQVAHIGSQERVHVALPVGPVEGKESAEIRIHQATVSRKAAYSAAKLPKREGKSVPKYSPIVAPDDRCSSSNGVSSGIFALIPQKITTPS